MKFLLPFLSIIGLSLFCCAQVPVKNIFVYKTERLPGTVRVNEKGEQVSPNSFITYQAYVESAGHVIGKRPGLKGDLIRLRLQKSNSFR